MARYRKIDTRIWNDEKFRALGDDGKLDFFFLLTHPHMTSIGAMRATLPGLASEIGWDLERLSKGFAEASSKGMAEHDPVASVIWLPNFIYYNVPENPNVLKAWAGAVDLLPECDLTRKAIQAVKDFAEGLPEAFQKALPEVFTKGLPKGYGNTGAVAVTGAGTEKTTAPPEGVAGFALQPEKPKVKIVNGNVTMKTFFERCREAGESPVPETDPVFAYCDKAKIPQAFVALAWRVFRAKYLDSAKKYIDWRRAFRNYVEAGAYGLWTVDAASSAYVLTGKGRQAEMVHAQ